MEFFFKIHSWVCCYWHTPLLKFIYIKVFHHQAVFHHWTIYLVWGIWSVYNFVASNSLFYFPLECWMQLQKKLKGITFVCWNFAKTAISSSGPKVVQWRTPPLAGFLEHCLFEWATPLIYFCEIFVVGRKKFYFVWNIVQFFWHILHSLWKQRMAGWGVKMFHQVSQVSQNMALFLLSISTNKKPKSSKFSNICYLQVVQVLFYSKLSFLSFIFKAHCSILSGPLFCILGSLDQEMSIPNPNSLLSLWVQMCQFCLKIIEFKKKLLSSKPDTTEKKRRWEKVWLGVGTPPPGLVKGHIFLNDKQAITVKP